MLFRSFEALTALAFVAFAEHPVDVGIIEAGLGALGSTGPVDVLMIPSGTGIIVSPLGSLSSLS